MSPNPFLKGKNATVTFLLGNSLGKAENLVIQAKSLTIKPNVTDIADGLLGEDRDDLDSETNFYDVNFAALIRNARLIAKLLDHQKGKDLKVAMSESAIGVVIKPHDGTTQAFQLRGYVLGAWEWNIGGRVERVEVPIPGRATHFEPIEASF
jgi:hypothetical protein